jgi:hypothetical protein
MKMFERRVPPDDDPSAAELIAHNSHGDRATKLLLRPMENGAR